MMEMKFNSQVCTDKVQSERLLALGLKKETADMHYSTDHRGNVRQLWLLAYGDLHKDVQVHSLPAWSLHRLLSLYNLHYIEFMNEEEIESVYDIVIDAIEQSIKGGSFNKEYLV